MVTGGWVRADEEKEIGWSQADGCQVGTGGWGERDRVVTGGWVLLG